MCYALGGGRLGHFCAETALEIRGKGKGKGVASRDSDGESEVKITGVTGSGAAVCCLVNFGL